MGGFWWGKRNEEGEIPTGRIKCPRGKEEGKKRVKEIYFFEYTRVVINKKAEQEISKNKRKEKQKEKQK